jgi:hypothetical protein
MSLNIVPLASVVTAAPITRVSDERRYAILRPAGQVNFQTWNSSSISTGNIAWSSPPPSLATLIARKVLMQIDMTLNFVGTNASVGPSLPLIQAQAGIDGLRAYPIQSCISTLTVTINGSALSVQSSDLIQAYQRLNMPEKQVADREMSFGPSMSDQFQSYEQGYGTNRNPLAPYGSNPYVSSRGAFGAVYTGALPPPNFGTSAGGLWFPPATNSAAPAPAPVNNTTGQVLFTVCEEIMVSPLSWACPPTSGFVGVSAFDVNLTWGDLTRMWSRDAVTALGAPFLSSITAINPVVRGARLVFEYDTASSLQPIPRSIVLPYVNITRYSTDYTTPLLPGGIAIINSNTISLPSIPKRLILTARRSNNQQTWNTSDCFLVLQKIQMNFMNQSGQSSSQTMESAYLQSQKNGLQLSWPQYSNFVGSVYVLDFGVDSGIFDPSLSVGCSEQTTLQITANYINTGPATINSTTMYMTVELEGTASIRDASFYPATSVISRADVLAASSKPEVLYEDSNYNRLGGAFDSLNNVKSLIKQGREEQSKAPSQDGAGLIGAAPPMGEMKVKKHRRHKMLNETLSSR